MHPIEDIFEIESTENDQENFEVERLIDYEGNDRIERFSKEEIDELKGEILRVESMLSNKK